MFMAKRGDHYYEVDGNSRIKVKDQKYNVLIPGIEGEYTEQELTEKINLKVKGF